MAGYYRNTTEFDEPLKDFEPLLPRNRKIVFQLPNSIAVEVARVEVVPCEAFHDIPLRRRHKRRGFAKPADVNSCFIFIV